MKIKHNPLTQLFEACENIKDLYNISIYGIRHQKARLINLLNKTSDKSYKRLNEELEEAIKEIKAIDNAKNSKELSIKFTSKEISIIKSVLYRKLMLDNKLPLLARYQAIITLSASFEGYINDVIKSIYDIEPRVLKSNKTSLKDNVLVDAINSGNPLEILKQYRLRDVMYGSVNDWFEYMRTNLNFKIEDNLKLSEMFLVRNAIVHNNACITKELFESKSYRYKKTGNKLNVTENDIQNYIKDVKECGSLIWENKTGKFK